MKPLEDGLSYRMASSADLVACHCTTESEPPKANRPRPTKKGADEMDTLVCVF